ncbi:MAG: di-heme oxidoredictase family protein, partial [Verrucomicrobiota bacterium]
MRVSLPTPGPHGEALPDPIYGGQIQGQAVPGVPPEADVFVKYEEVVGQFGDGKKFSLRRPTYSLSNFGYGPLAQDALLSPRVSPAMIGMGLLEAVPTETLRELAARQKIEDRDIAGRINFVWDAKTKKKIPGRFGWKAEQPSVLEQVAGAFNEDM